MQNPLVVEFRYSNRTMILAQNNYKAPPQQAFNYKTSVADFYDKVAASK